MRAPRPTSDIGSALIVACSLLLALAVCLGRGIAPVAALLAVLSILVAWHRWILTWRALLFYLVAVVLFVPVSRYSMAISLPFGLELYRIVVALILLVWVASLLVDPRVRVRRTPLDGPVALIVAASLGSIAVNYARVVPLASPVLKGLTVFLSFVVLYYFVSSVVKTTDGVVKITQFIVGGAAVVAFFSIIEQRTGFNLFDHVRTVLPFLQFEGGGSEVRYGLIRATGSADHPIALGVLFATVLPLGLSLAITRSSVWWLPTTLVLVGVLASGSRTPFMALVAAGGAILWLRPYDLRRLLPLTIPMLIVIKIIAPGSIATLKESFFPSSGPGLVASQYEIAGDPTLSSGRANFRPRLREGMHRPLFGQGLGTRQTGLNNPLRNAPVLDNQWLGTFLDIGLVGVAGWLWLIGRSTRLLARIARNRASPVGLLAAGFVASILGFGVAMVTYDSLAFIQETFVLWIVLALAARLIADGPHVSVPAVK